MGETDNNKTYSTLQPPSLPSNQHTFPTSQSSSDSRLLNYVYMDGESTAATPASVSPTTGVNFVGCQSGQQNQILDSQSINRHYSQDENGCYLQTTLQNCSPTARTDPIAGLAQMTEKANFTAELSDLVGDTRSGIHSRNSLARINRSHSFPTSPTLRNSMMESTRVEYEHYRESFQGSYMDDSMGNSLYPVDGSTMSDMVSSRHLIRRQQRNSTYMYSDQGPEYLYNHYKYPDDREQRLFNYYQTLNKDKSGVIPNVTVINTDPKSKAPQFFAPVKSQSEEILKKTLSTFGKILSPTESEDQRREVDKWSSGNDSRKDKLCPTTKGSVRNSTEQSGDDRLCPCKWMGCDAIYSEQEDLVRHIEKVHIDQRKADDLYICYWEQCTRQTKPFNARYKLVIHMRVHSGEKPNKCTVSEQLQFKCEKVRQGEIRVVV